MNLRRRRPLYIRSGGGPPDGSGTAAASVAPGSGLTNGSGGVSDAEIRDGGTTGMSDAPAPPAAAEDDSRRVGTAGAFGILGRALADDGRALGRRCAERIGAGARRVASALRSRDGASALGSRIARAFSGNSGVRGRRWRIVALGAAVAVCAAILFVAGLLGWALWGLDLSGIAEESRQPTVVLETVEGQTFATKGPFRGPPIARESLPDHLVDAVVAIEDRRFYSHLGIDPLGVARALLTNLVSGRVVEGGSTITQQLARVLFLTQDRTLKRKLCEAALAVWLEMTLSKDEILTRYLGNVYMGAGAYGMAGAARVCFDKELPDLTLAESAMLAGLIKAPSDLNPRKDLEAARARAATVLDAMVDAGRLDPPDAAAAKAAPAEIYAAGLPGRSGGWFADWAYEEAAELAGSFNGSMHVRTTLHPRLQAIAEKAVASVMDAEGAARKAGEAALVAMLPDGAVLALVGGRDYEASQFDRATDALRQPGSTFKPFVYWAALRQGRSLNDWIEDAPVEIDGWRPENYSGRYHGRVRLVQALVHSLNAATVRLAQDVGVENVAAAARELGIDSPLEANPSLALGTSEVTLIDLTAAYASLVNGRAPVEPWGIVDFGTAGPGRFRLGPRTPATAALDDRRLELLAALQMAVEQGTGRAAAIDGFAAGKTGTTQDYRDAWFVGTNGSFVVGVWVGNDDDSPMDGVTGGDLPARIWRQFMTETMALVREGDPILKPRAGSAATGGTATDASDDGGALQCNVSACESAYRSFRRSDCTFQPYSGPRERCAK